LVLKQERRSENVQTSQNSCRKSLREAKGDTAFILLLRSTYSPPLHPRQNQSLLVFRGTPIVNSQRKFQKNSPLKIFFAIHLLFGAQWTLFGKA